MGRPPNLAISSWNRSTRPGTWDREAHCGRRRDLPWVSNIHPDDDDEHRMKMVCNHCPVLVECASYVVQCRKGGDVVGGFYAGVWLPWPSAGETNAIKSERRRNLGTLQAMLIVEAGTNR